MTKYFHAYLFSTIYVQQTVQQKSLTEFNQQGSLGFYKTYFYELFF